MGKGDKKTKKGKIVKGTFGNSRRRKSKRATGSGSGKAEDKKTKK